MGEKSVKITTVETSRDITVTKETTTKPGFISAMLEFGTIGLYKATTDVKTEVTRTKK